MRHIYVQIFYTLITLLVLVTLIPSFPLMLISLRVIYLPHLSDSDESIPSALHPPILLLGAYPVEYYNVPGCVRTDDYPAKVG